jgi:hypothetical protein
MDKELGKKFDKKKRQWWLLPIEPIEQVVDILQFGAEKYAPDNWKHVQPYDERYYSAAMRHITAWRKGEVIDPESGKHHLAHAICCLIFIMWHDNNKEEKSKENSND